MTKNIVVYYDKPSSITSSHIHLSDINSIPNGSCDTIMFTELNKLDISNYSDTIGVLLAKLKINKGLLLLQLIHLDRVASDIFYTKIDDVAINNILYNGARSACHENTIVQFILKCGGKISQFTFNDYNLKLEVIRNG